MPHSKYLITGRFIISSCIGFIIIIIKQFIILGYYLNLTEYICFY